MPTKTRPSTIAGMYINEGLSSSQIAERLNLSKTCVLEKLRSLGINRKSTKRQPMTNPKNYRTPVAPYGYKKIDDQLRPNNKEIKICREIVRLINDEGLSYRATATYLIKKKRKNRNGNIAWGHSTVSSIYKRWKDKI